MMSETTVGPTETCDQDEMHHREITLADGRYMIFYTFGHKDDEPEHGEELDRDV